MCFQHLLVFLNIKLCSNWPHTFFSFFFLHRHGNTNHEHQLFVSGITTLIVYEGPRDGKLDWHFHTCSHQFSEDSRQKKYTLNTSVTICRKPATDTEKSREIERIKLRLWWKHQQKIRSPLKKTENTLGLFVPCTGHSFGKLMTTVS